MSYDARSKTNEFKIKDNNDKKSERLSLPTETKEICCCVIQKR